MMYISKRLLYKMFCIEHKRSKTRVYGIMELLLITNV